MHKPATFQDLIAEVEALDLYQKLLVMLNKDLLLANINLQFEDDVTPQLMFEAFQEVVFHLIREKFNDYLNLLYIVDVPERDIKKLDGSDVFQLSKTVTFLILKREWQKVWYKAHY
ncbi:hypothetical protein [Paucihalobacter sp.]|uniref:hypothetical protein n=1 Tax=Paucihalobacter sp. TaxID=2850405 RepID=UPI003D1608B7